MTALCNQHSFNQKRSFVLLHILLHSFVLYDPGTGERLALEHGSLLQQHKGSDKILEHFLMLPSLICS